MKPLKDMESFMKSMNKTHGTYTCIVLDNLEMISQQLYSIIQENLKRKNIFDRPYASIFCGDSFDSGKPYCIKTLEGYNERKIGSVVAELMNSIPEETEFIFVEMFFEHFGTVFSWPKCNKVRLVMYQRPPRDSL